MPKHVENSKVSFWSSGSRGRVTLCTVAEIRRLSVFYLLLFFYSVHAVFSFPISFLPLSLSLFHPHHPPLVYFSGFFFSLLAFSSPLFDLSSGGCLFPGWLKNVFSSNYTPILYIRRCELDSSSRENATFDPRVFSYHYNLIKCV